MLNLKKSHFRIPKLSPIKTSGTGSEKNNFSNVNCHGKSLKLPESTTKT